MNFAMALVSLLVFGSIAIAEEFPVACKTVGRSTCMHGEQNCAFPLYIKCGNYSSKKFMADNDYGKRGNVSIDTKVSALEINVEKAGKVEFLVLKNPPGVLNDYSVANISQNQWVKDQLKIRGIVKPEHLVISNLLFKTTPDLHSAVGSSSSVDPNSGSGGNR